MTGRAEVTSALWMVLGLALLGYFMARDRSWIAETRRVFTEETPAERGSRLGYRLRRAAWSAR